MKNSKSQLAFVCKSRIISIIAITSLLFSMLILTAGAATKLGDVDGDNIVTVSDARLVLRAAINLEKYTKSSVLYLAGNVDGDSTLSVNDARAVLRVAIGLDSFGGTGTEKKSYTIRNKVIVDNSYCKFTVVSVDPDGFLGFTVNVLCENKTNKTLMFAFDNTSVMGYMIEPFWACEVSPGKKANSEISFYTESFQKVGITWVDEISFLLRVYNSEDWSVDPYVESTYTIYPTGLSSAQIVYPKRVPVKGEKTIVDNKYITFIIESVDPNGFLGYTINFYINNKTDKTIMVAWDDVSVNDFMITSFFATEIAPGKQMYSSTYFDNDELTKNGIQTVKNIEFTLRAYDNRDWSVDPFVESTFTYRP